MSETSVFEKRVPDLGRFWLRAMQPADLPLIHAWVNQPHAGYWGLAGKSLPEVAAAYDDIRRRGQVWIGYAEQTPSFLVETYWPGDDVVGQHYPVRESDRGMHVLVAAPAAGPRSGFTWAVFRTVMEHLFADPQVARVVVEPDIRNGKIHALNRRAGFRYQRAIALPNKTAHLAFCTRADYRAAVEDHAPFTPAITAHLQPEAWAEVNRRLVRKAISELAHERLIAPTDEGGGRYRLTTSAGSYHFHARRLALEHWDIELASVTKQHDEVTVPIDALDLFIELAEPLGPGPQMLPVYLEEILSTLYGASHRLVHQQHSAADLVHADYQQVEMAMSEGHPAFIANSGRVGFDADDYRAYAPEAGAPVQLVWLAAHRRHTEWHGHQRLGHDDFMAEELGAATIARFEAVLFDAGVDPVDYYFFPVHPWQWANKLSRLFVADLARRDLVCLGEGPDHYQAQQSIRTFFNRSQPRRHLVKVALSILNMGFMRGLSADYMAGTPAINSYLVDLLAQDRSLAQMGFRLLPEVAAIGYRNPLFERALPRSSPYRKMLAALWRESPVTRVSPGQRLMTMAALLHRDGDGIALLPQLIQASGLDIDGWLDRYLNAYFAPLLHCFYAYDLAFMPHGENLILVLQDHAVTGAFLKDIAEEAVIMDPHRQTPPEVRRLCMDIPEPLRLLSIFTDVFDGFFRYLGQVLLADAGYPEARFWSRVAACARAYQAAHPHLADKFARYDLFAPTFLHSCLNRLQLRDNQQMVDLTDPAKSLRFSGTLDNPLYSFR
jgi:siderophore synthetase component/RimJ/RimL family protein N-acetyltransferase